MMQNPSDLPAWQRVVEHVPGVGPKTAAKIHSAMLEGGGKYLSGVRSRNKEVAEVLDFMDELGRSGSRPAPLLAMVLEFYQPILEKKFADDYPRRQSGLEQLSRIAGGYETLDAFLADISLESPDEDDAPEGEDVLVLSTVHSAKGLEWSAVVIIDLVQDRFPSRHALQRAEDLEEERRLLYVACTRAREQLCLFVPAVLYNQYNGASEPLWTARSCPSCPTVPWNNGARAIRGLAARGLRRPAHPRAARAPRRGRGPSTRRGPRGSPAHP